MKKSLKLSIIIIPCALILSFFAFTGLRFAKITMAESATTLSQEENTALKNQLKSIYSDKYSNLKSLPYNLSKTELDIQAKAAILIDTSNGCILYEKNADEIIPPASMTKLFSMYVVFEDVMSGKLAFDQEIDLPPEAWACNAPPHSSLMFLGKGHHVTVDELLKGTSISSGNDAAYALAYATSGSMDNFIDRMNSLADRFGLNETHFVEASGYSELNSTTARQMADFARRYINFYPDAIEKYHSIQSFTYPKKENMADGDIYKAQDWSAGLPEHITMGITQQNTNPLLGKLDGVDGLKTGYIDESGYNLALTARRMGTRFLSVTMGGPGNNAREGNAGRVHDGKELMEWAFSTFKDYTNMKAVKSYFVRTSGAKTISVNLIPAYIPESLTVPFIYGNSVEESVENVRVVLNLPKKIDISANPGDILGKISFTLGDTVLESIPLVCDREIKKAGPLTRLADTIVWAIIGMKD